MQIEIAEHRDGERQEYRAHRHQHRRRLQRGLKILPGPGHHDAEQRVSERHRENVGSRKHEATPAVKRSPERASIPERIGIIGKTQGVNDRSNPKPVNASSTATILPCRGVGSGARSVRGPNGVNDLSGIVPEPGPSRTHC